MNIPVRKQKVVAYNKLQNKGLVIRVEVVTIDDKPIPPIRLWKEYKSIKILQ